MSSGFSGKVQAPWSDSFKVDGGISGNVVRFSQISATRFALQSSLIYLGDTGLEEKGLSDAQLAEIRLVSPDRLPITDLASVPDWATWLVPKYGLYTPAALIHDRLTTNSNKTPITGITRQDADRYFRFMLRDLGVPFGRRWVMWTAVALHTRYLDVVWRKLSVILWFLLAFLGMASFGYGVIENAWPVIAVASLVPLPASFLWGKQYIAGLIAAYIAIPWILPPSIFVLVFYGIFKLIERAARFFVT